MTKHSYIGYLLPTLISLQNKLADAVLPGIAKRFNGYFERSDFVVTKA